MDSELIAIIALGVIMIGGMAGWMLIVQPLLKRWAIAKALGPVTDGSRPEHWTIGPIVRGNEHRSVGTPLHPSAEPGALFAFDIPQAPGHIHAVTFNHGPLIGKSRLRIRYRVEMAEGVRIAPQTGPTFPASIALYFQRAGDDWRALGETETYRWYSTFAYQAPIQAGVHEIVAPLDARWTATRESNAIDQAAEFGAALEHAESVGIVFGGATGWSHGVFAEGGRARMIVQEFSVE